MPSFEKIWKENKSLFELVGIVCGVGALFLSIPTPSNLQAANALSQIQFIWLIFIALSIIALLVRIGLLVSEFQSTLEEKFDVRFYRFGSPMIVIGTLLVIFCMGIWNFAESLYSKPLFHFLSLIAALASGALLFVIEFFLKKRFPRPHFEISFVLLYSLNIAVFGYLSVAFFQLAMPFGYLDTSEPKFWLLNIGAVLVLFLITLTLTLRQRNRAKKEVVSDT